MVPQVDQPELPMEQCQLKINKDNYKIGRISPSAMIS
jgi:hypothetical protein